MTSGGEGDSSFTPEQVTNIDTAATRINAVPGTGPVIPTPSFTIPAEGLVPVFLATRLGATRRNDTVYIRYRNPGIPLELGEWNEAVAEAFAFNKPTVANGLPYVLLWDTDHVPPAAEGEAVYRADGDTLALDENNGEFNVPPLTGGRTSYTLAELLKMRRDGIT